MMDEEMKKMMEDMNISDPDVKSQLSTEPKPDYDISAPIDRFRNCPVCIFSWKGEDMIAKLNKVDAFSHKSKSELTKIAIENFGYSIPEGNTTFSKLVHLKIKTKLDITPKEFYQCPNCKSVWDALTGKYSPNLQLAKNGNTETKDPSRITRDESKEEIT